MHLHTCYGFISEYVFTYIFTCVTVQENLNKLTALTTCQKVELNLNEIASP